MNRVKLKIKEMVIIAMFASLTAICSQLLIPLPFTPVPLNLSTLAVFIAGGLLGTRNGGISQIVYVVLGAIGVPVFAGFTGGIGIVVGPTGGYIIGYIAAAFIIGALMNILPKKIWSYALAMLCGLFACYLIGTLWFIVATKTDIVTSLIMCVVPFLPGDFIKIALAALLVKRLERVVKI